MHPIACPHTDAASVRHVCQHLLAVSDDDYLQRFTGASLDYELICRPCATEPEAIAAQLRAVCVACFDRIEKEGFWDGIVGEPRVRERATKLAFVHEQVTMSAPVPALLAIEPVNIMREPVFIALTNEGDLISLDLAAHAVTPLANVMGSKLNLGQLVSLHVAPDGRRAALANRRGEDAVVCDLATGRIVLELSRGNHSGASGFPLAFARLDGRTLLVHGTQWNRLDVTDLSTGEVVTARESPVHRQPHYLDYFHGSLSNSPDGGWILDNGWVWGPDGTPASWSLSQWLNGNVWESEDGSTRRELVQQYDWELPCCWIDAHTIALWGYQCRSEPEIAAVRLYNVTDGRLVRWFPGPEGRLDFDEYLFSSSEEGGTAVWDIATGERLLRDEALQPACYHRGARALLSVLPDGSFQLSRVRNGERATGDEAA